MSIIKIFRYLFFLVFFIMSFKPAYAQTASTIRVAVFECPPFVIEQQDNSYTGLSIDLWNYLAKQMGFEYTLEALSLKEMLEGVSKGQFDVGVSCTSITPEREKFLDFSHSFYETHSAIAIKKHGLFSVGKNILINKKMLLFLLFIVSASSIVGGIYYFLERNINKNLFSMSSPAKRVIEAFLLGLLFITKGPFNYFQFKTLTGRVLTVLLAVATTFFLAGITAILASSFTLGMLRSDIQNIDDLNGKKIGAIRGSTSSNYLTSHSLPHRKYDYNEALVEALDNDNLEAIVADAAVLKYQIKKGKDQDRYRHLSVLPYQFQEQNYGFALVDNSPIEERLNQALLEIRRSIKWEVLLTKYFAGDHY